MRIGPRVGSRTVPTETAEVAEAPPPPPPPAPPPAGFNRNSSFGAPPPVVPQGDAPTAAELAPFPGGKPESYVKTLFPPAPGATADRQEMIDTVVGAMPPAQQAQARALIETGGDAAKQPLQPGETLISSGVSDESLKKAFDQVLEARKKPGSTTLSLDLTPQRVVQGPEQSGGDSSSYLPPPVTEPGKAVKFSFTANIDAAGKVNGVTLAVDQQTRLATELKKVAPELKDQALRDAGVPADFIAGATMEQKEQALAKLRAATLTPGTRTVDIGFDQTSYTGGGDAGQGEAVTTRIGGPVTLKVDAQGNVGGKPLFIETALATTRVMEQLPMAEKKAMLQSLGFQADDLKPLAADRATEILTRVSMLSKTPGEHRLEVDSGPDKFLIGLKVSDQGELEGAGVTKLPPPPKKKIWQTVLSVVGAVVSIVFPPAAPFIQVAQAAMAVANGARGAGLIGAVLGGAAGLAGIAGATSLAGTLSTAANVVNSANGVVQGIRSGNVLGAFSAVASLAGAAGNLAGGSVPSSLGLAGRVAGVASAIRSGDIAGVISGVNGLANTPTGATGATPQQPVDDLGGETFVGPPTPAELRPDFVGPPAPDDLGAGTFVGPPTPAELRDDFVGPPAPDDLGEGTFVGPPAPTEGPGQTERGTVTVGRGDNLSVIARRYGGDWAELYEYNRDKLPNGPNSIRAGVELEIPPPDFQISETRRNEIYAQAHIPRPPPGTGTPGEDTGDVGDPQPLPAEPRPPGLNNLSPAEITRTIDASMRGDAAAAVQNMANIEALTYDTFREQYIARVTEQAHPDGNGGTYTHAEPSEQEIRQAFSNELLRGAVVSRYPEFAPLVGISSVDPLFQQQPVLSMLSGFPDSIQLPGGGPPVSIPHLLSGLQANITSADSLIGGVVKPVFSQLVNGELAEVLLKDPASQEQGFGGIIAARSPQLQAMFRQDPVGALQSFMADPQRYITQGATAMQLDPGTLQGFINRTQNGVANLVSFFRNGRPGGG